MVEYIEVDYNPDETKRRSRGLKLYMVVASIWILLIGTYIVLDFGLHSKNDSTTNSSNYEDPDVLGIQEEKKYLMYDLNKDGRFDQKDLEYFLKHYKIGDDERLDFNGNGRYKQDIVDFKLFMKEYNRFFGQEDFTDLIKKSKEEDEASTDERVNDKEDRKKIATESSKDDKTQNESTPTPIPSDLVIVTLTPTPTPTPKPTNTPTPTSTPMPTSTPTPIPTPTPTPTPEPEPTEEPTPTPEPTQEPTPTPEPEPTPEI